MSEQTLNLLKESEARWVDLRFTGKLLLDFDTKFVAERIDQKVGNLLA